MGTSQAAGTREERRTAATSSVGVVAVWASLGLRPAWHLRCAATCDAAVMRGVVCGMACRRAAGMPYRVIGGIGEVAEYTGFRRVCWAPLCHGVSN